MTIRFMKYWKILALTGIALGALAIGGLMFTADHWWKKWREARVIYNGRFSGSSQVYRSAQGNLLVVLSEPAEDSFYIIYPDRQIVGMPNRSNFRLLPGYAFSREVPPLIANMKGAKGETDPELVVRDKFLQFKSFDRAQVQIMW